MTLQSASIGVYRTNPPAPLSVAAQVAEYVESRPELAAGLSKKDATLRSASVQFQVQPCQPVTLR